MIGRSVRRCAPGGENRGTVLGPAESAHGTNPATGGRPRIPRGGDSDVRERGRHTSPVEAVKAKLSDDVAAIMLTNPNTCGLFEPEIRRDRRRRSTEAGDVLLRRRGELHTPLVGKAKPGDLGRRRHALQPVHKYLFHAPRRWRAGIGPGGPVGASRPVSPRSRLLLARTARLVGAPSTRRARENCPSADLTAFHGQMGCTCGRSPT